MIGLTQAFDGAWRQVESEIRQIEPGNSQVDVAFGGLGLVRCIQTNRE